MTFQIQEQEDCIMNIHYIADEAKVEEKRNQAVEQIKKNKTPVPGFRPGMAPVWAIKMRMKDEIDKWVSRELVAAAYDEILFESRLKPIAYPKVTRQELNDKSYWCDMIWYVKPVFELKQYKNFEIPKPHSPYSINDVAERMMQELRNRHAEMTPFGENDFIQSGDRITCDWTCFGPDGQKIPELSVDGTLYALGSSDFPEFDDGLYGMKADEEREFTVPLSDKMKALPFLKDLSSVTFKVHVHMGLKMTLPALDDEFAKKAGFENFDAMQKSCQGAALARLNLVDQQQVSQQIMLKLLAEHDIKIPSWLITAEAQSQCAARGLNWMTLEKEIKDKIIEQSAQAVKLSLILDSIREAEPETVFSDQELINVLSKRAEDNGQDPKEFLVQSQKDGSLFGMIEALKNEALMQWLLKNSKVVD